MWKNFIQSIKEKIMITFKDYLIEAKIGDCFEIAGKAMITPEPKFAKYITLIHAIVNGTGKLEGRKFVHAWNELGDIILDNSNGKKVVMKKSQYYALGKINPKTKGAYKKYTREQATKHMQKSRHFGPWHINEKLEEEIPDEPREIGKKKVKISPELFATIPK
jgi:hypothetical protein